MKKTHFEKLRLFDCLRYGKVQFLIEFIYVCLLIFTELLKGLFEICLRFAQILKPTTHFPYSTY